jgi:hypothetical protein
LDIVLMAAYANLGKTCEKSHLYTFL